MRNNNKIIHNKLRYMMMIFSSCTDRLDSLLFCFFPKISWEDSLVLFVLLVPCLLLWLFLFFYFISLAHVLYLHLSSLWLLEGLLSLTLVCLSTKFILSHVT